MLNTFPELLNLSFFAPLILRMALGILLIEFSLACHRKNISLTSFFRERKIPLANIFTYKLIILQFLSGLLLIVGLYTQISVLVSIYTLLVLMFINKRVKILRFDNSLYVLLILISISLLLTGAGALALDLPL